MSRFSSPLRYPGGKACIFNFVSSLMIQNNLVGMSYAEPYAGGAGLALKLLYDEYVDNIYINDLDRSIYAFWKIVTERNTLFCDWIEGVEVSVDSWNFYKSIQNNSKDYDLIDLAKSTFFLNRTNVSGVIKGGIIGGINQEGKYKIDARFKKSELIQRIQKIEKFKHRINVSNEDGLVFIRRMNSIKQPIFIYLDPPYVLKGADLYMNYYSKFDHEKLALSLKKINQKWMVSYDHNDFILNLYANNEKISYKLSQSTSNRVGTEIIIFDGQLNYKESLEQLNSASILYRGPD